MREVGMELFEAVKMLAQWAVAGLIAIVGYLYRAMSHQSEALRVHGTEIAVIKAVQAANKEAHDREFKEMKASFAKVLDKLDNIEAHLRK
jgi:Tfp pilus assembly protein PilO